MQSAEEVTGNVPAEWGQCCQPCSPTPWLVCAADAASQGLFCSPAPAEQSLHLPTWHKSLSQAEPGTAPPNPCSKSSPSVMDTFGNQHRTLCGLGSVVGLFLLPSTTHPLHTEGLGSTAHHPLTSNPSARVGSSENSPAFCWE